MSNYLRITHTTLYEYTKPTRFGRHRLVLRPREGHDLQVESMLLEIKPACQIAWSRDIFSNSVASVDFLTPGSELSIISRVVVRWRWPSGSPSSAPIPVQHPVVYDELESTVVAAYRNPVYPEEGRLISDWLNGVLSSGDSPDALIKVAAVNAAIYRSIRYKRREVKGVQRPSETLADRSGSCRDMATLLMEACRTLGIAARFSSGYLDCPAARTGLASTHAWTEAYFPGSGWIGFDPTLGEQTSYRHIAVGVSNHPRGVMPISGRFFGNSLDSIGMKVSVKIEASESSGTSSSVTLTGNDGPLPALKRST